MKLLSVLEQGLTEVGSVLDLINNNGISIAFIWWLMRTVQTRLDKIIEVQIKQQESSKILLDLVKIVLSERKGKGKDND